MRKIIVFIVFFLLVGIDASASNMSRYVEASETAGEIQTDLAIGLCKKDQDFGRDYPTCRALLDRKAEKEAGRRVEAVTLTLLDFADLMIDAQRRGLVGPLSIFANETRNAVTLCRSDADLNREERTCPAILQMADVFEKEDMAWILIDRPILDALFAEAARRGLKGPGVPTHSVPSRQEAMLKGEATISPELQRALDLCQAGVMESPYRSLCVQLIIAHTLHKSGMPGQLNISTGLLDAIYAEAARLGLPM